MTKQSSSLIAGCMAVLAVIALGLAPLSVAATPEQTATAAAATITAGAGKPGSAGAAASSGTAGTPTTANPVVTLPATGEARSGSPQSAGLALAVIFATVVIGVGVLMRRRTRRA